MLRKNSILVVLDMTTPNRDKLKLGLRVSPRTVWKYLPKHRDYGRGKRAWDLDQHLRDLGIRVLKTPPQSPQANALCKRLIGGTLRRECLDFLILLTAHPLQHLLHEWMLHYNNSRPHMALGPGIPQPPQQWPVPLQAHRHRIPNHQRVVVRPILGGVHHDYGLEQQVV